MKYTGYTKPRLIEKIECLEHNLENHRQRAECALNHLREFEEFAAKHGVVSYSEFEEGVAIVKYRVLPIVKDGEHGDVKDNQNPRSYFAVSVKHSIGGWKFGEPLVLWGVRTNDGEARSFGGYTSGANNAELYTLDDWQNPYRACSYIKTDEPVKMCLTFCKKYKRFDTVLVEASHYLKYCEVCGL